MKIFFALIFLFCISTDSYSQHTFRTYRDHTKYNGKNPDIRIFRSFNNLKGSFVHTLVDLSNESILPVSIFTPIVLYTSARIYKNHYDESSAVLLAVSEITNSSITQLIKYIAERDRPFRLINNVKLTDTFDVEGSYSFPSGHVSESFTLATALTLRYHHSPILITGLYTYALIVSLGRIYWGVHYPSDVLAGMVVGSGISALIYSLRKPIIEYKNKLFNQEDRTDSYTGGGKGTNALLLSVIAADALNFIFSKSKNSFIKNSNINVGISGNVNTLNYRLNF